MVVLSRSSSLTRLCFRRHKNSDKDSENMRIADVLSGHSDDGDGDDDDSVEKFDENKRKRGDFDPSSLSRSLISRWFSKNYSFRIIKKKKKEADSGEDLDADQPARSGEVAVVDPASDSEARRSEELSIDSGRKNEDFSVNFGMGVGLVFLLAKSATEFNKMTELRAEMEMLLKEIKHKVRRKDDIASSSESNTNISFSPSHCCRDIDTSRITSMPNCGACFSLQEAKCDAESDSGSKYATAFANARSLSIGQMEEELEVELERLQHNLDGQGSSVLQHRLEVDCENNDPSIESFSLNCEEEEDVPRDANHEYHGVSARELERKLHELLEMRQQEKIAELESALECAKQKLREKEMELQWWKETQWVASFKRGQSIHLAGNGERIILSEEK